MIGLRFAVLGTLQVMREGERVEPGAFKQRSLLALLLIHRNRVVSTDRVIDELWGDDASSDRHGALWVHVSNLRTMLEPDRPKGSPGTVLITRSPGYLLEVADDQVDSGEFEQLLAEGRALLHSDPSAASLVLSEALHLWRGRAYEDFTYESFAQTEIARLTELRMEAVEARIEADLERGLGPELVGELEALTREHPLRERLVGQLMRALHRSGRRAESLRAFTALRRRLGEELGIEPSSHLADLEESMLTDATEFSEPREGQPASGTGLAVRGYELREEIGAGGSGSVYRAFQAAVGREVAIKLIRPELANDAGFVRRFEAETKVVAGLEHPHIVSLHDYWREPGGAYLVMPLMRGGSLAGATLSEDNAIEVLAQVASALAAAHEHGISHGDLKPQNVLLDEEGNAFLADFGIADGTPAPEMDLRGLGRLLRETLGSGESPGPGEAALLEVADRALAAGAAGGYVDVESFLIDLGRVSGRPSLAASAFPDNPYKGLRPFQEGDAGLFFGRERVVERLVNRLGATGVEGSFVVLVGSSGSGKSSVVKAGLLPAVRRGAVHGSGGWFVAEMIPGAHPFRELERALERMAVDPPPTLLEQLEVGPGGLRRIVEAILPGDEDSKLLLVIDQLEELFIQTRDEDLTRRFLAGLTEAVSATSARLRVVATLRADFYDRPLRYQGFADLLRAGTEVITPMSAEEVERAVAGPAEAVGVGPEPGLAAAVVADVADEPSALPLMQYAMTEVFERRQGTTLTVASYREIGGVTGALGRRAEELYQGLDSSGREIARQVFLQLISLGEREEDTRRRVRRSELAGLGETPEEVDGLVETYGRHRLLTFDRDPVSRGPTVEVAHEALLSEWLRYKGWVEEAREELRIQRRFNTAASEWQLNDEEPGYLLTGPRLQEAEAWLASTDLAVAPLLHGYIIKSAENADAEMRTRRRRRRLATSVIGVVAATALALLMFGITQRSAANRLAAVEKVNRLVESAEDVLPRDPELSLLLGAEAVEESQALGLEVFPKNLEVLHDALRAHRLLFTVDDATSAVFTPEGDRVYIGHPGGTISVRDATTGEGVDRIATQSSSVRDKPGAPPMPLAISRDGRWLTTGYAVIDTNEMTSTKMSWPEDRLALVEVDISDDGSLLALAHYETGSSEGSVTLWHRQQQTELWSVRLQAPLGVDFDSEGRRLAVSNNTTDLDSNWTHIFDVETGDQVEVIPMEDPVAVRFHPDGDRLAINDAPGIIRFWDPESRDFIPRVEAGHSVTIQDLDFDGGGSLLASGDISGVVIVRDGETGNQLYTLPHHGGSVLAVDLSADGSRLATVTERQIDQPGPLRVFDTAREGGQDLTTVYLGGFPATLDIHPSGDSIAVGSHVDGRRQTFTMTGQPLMVLPHHQPFSQVVGVAGPIAFSPDGETLATGDARGNVALWDAESGAELESRNVREMVPDMGETLGTTSGLGEAVFVVEFSPDGERLGLGGAGFVLVADRENLDDPVLLHVSDLTFTESLSFSPDGQRLIAGRAKGVPGTQTQVIPAILEWDVSTGEQVNSRSMAGRVMAADYSPLGDLVAYGTSDAVVLGADGFEIRHELTFDSRDIWDVAFSPDGTQLAVAYGDGSVVIWDPHTGLVLYELEAHDAFAADVEWTPDGTRLVSVGQDETLRTYAIDPQVLIDEARQRANRELTVEECRRYLSRERC